MVGTIAKEFGKELVYATVAYGLIKVTHADEILVASVKAGQAFGETFVQTFKDHFKKDEEDDFEVRFNNLTDEEKKMYAEFARNFYEKEA